MNTVDLYNRITRLLKEKNLSRRDLSSGTGISYNTLTALYQRQSDMSGSMLKQIADFFSVTVEFLLTGNDRPPCAISNSIVGDNNPHATITVTNGETHTRDLTEIETELLRICAKLDIKKKVELLTFASNLEGVNK